MKKGEKKTCLGQRKERHQANCLEGIQSDRGFVRGFVCTSCHDTRAVCKGFFFIYTLPFPSPASSFPPLDTSSKGYMQHSSAKRISSVSNISGNDFVSNRRKQSRLKRKRDRLCVHFAPGFNDSVNVLFVPGNRSKKRKPEAGEEQESTAKR